MQGVQVYTEDESKGQNGNSGLYGNPGPEPAVRASRRPRLLRREGSC